MAFRIPFASSVEREILRSPKDSFASRRKSSTVAPDPRKSLVHRQLAAWKEDPRLHSGQLYLLSPLNSMDVEVSVVGEARPVEQSLLQALLQRGAKGASGAFEDVREGERMLVYPLSNQGLLQGVWLLFPKDPYATLAAWADSAERFSSELSALSHAGLGDPPTFRQLVEAFPDRDDREPAREAKPHWERSRSQAIVPADQELAGGLIVDHLPLF